jgi:hypothetical protein
MNEQVAGILVFKFAWPIIYMISSIIYCHIELL